MQIYWNKRKRVHKKSQVQLTRIRLEHQKGRPFIVFDVMWKRSTLKL